MTSCEEDTTGGLLDADQVAGGGCGEDTILTDQELLHAVCRANLCDNLGDLWVPVPAITANDEEGVLCAFWDGLDNRSDEVLGVVLLLEDLDLLAKARAVDRVSANWS